MIDTFTISLPDGVSKDNIQEISSLLKKIDTVDDAGSMASRSGIDPASINLWIQIASGALSIGGAGIVITQKIKEILHSKKVTGAIIKLKDGTEISLDNSSPEEIAKIIVATK